MDAKSQKKQARELMGPEDLETTKGVLISLE